MRAFGILEIKECTDLVAVDNVICSRISHAVHLIVRLIQVVGKWTFDSIYCFNDMQFFLLWSALYSFPPNSWSCDLVASHYNLRGFCSASPCQHPAKGQGSNEMKPAQAKACIFLGLPHLVHDLCFIIVTIFLDCGLWRGLSTGLRLFWYFVASWLW